MKLDWATVMANMAAADENPKADEGEGWWDRLNVLIATQVEAIERAKERDRAEEWSRLMNIAPDGKTLHFFGSLPAQQWDYASYNADILIDWATTLVMARDNPALLGTFH